MNEKELEELVAAVNLPLEDPQFLGRLFTQIAKFHKQKRKEAGDPIRQLCQEEYDALSRRFDLTEVQESYSARNVLKTRKFAKMIIDEQGKVDRKALTHAIACIEKNLYSLGPDRQSDAHPQEHLLKVMRLLHSEKEFRQLLQSISKPVSHPQAEQIIRETLYLPAGTTITDAHTRQAALSAWFCYLRQHVGSCFATAPAIIVYSEQPKQFLMDIRELLETGRLKRTFGGVEYSAPLSTSWGAGDLRKPIFLGKKNLLGQSPGLVAAFQAMELITKGMKFAEKIAKSKELVSRATSTQQFITAEEILRDVLFQHLSLTEKDLEEYEKRPRGMVQAGLLLHVPKAAKGSGGKGEACSRFHELFKQGCDAFKSLTDNALLRSWEFTVASFAETKIKLAKYNLYASLGLGPEEPGGIGQCLYAIIKTRLDEHNAEVHKNQENCEGVFTQLKYLEGRLRRASTEQEMRWLKTEYQSRKGELYHFEQLRNIAHEKAQLFANLFNDLLDEYDRLFPEYFQEVYDADLHDVVIGPYDDSPAGFRLIYKAGRANTSQWTLVHTPEDFVDALANFFVGTESQILTLPQFEKVQEDVSAITTSIVTHVKTEDFLESAFMRMAIAHQAPLVKKPLENLDKVEKKPWAYTSGGTMGSLVSCYFGREENPTEVERWVEEEAELAVFLIDTLKAEPPKFAEEFLNHPERSMLMHSPTHAFLLKPGAPLFREAWQSDTYSYTWLRDHIVLPRQQFIENIHLDKEKVEFLVRHLEKKIPEELRPIYQETFHRLPTGLSPIHFREYLIETMETQPKLKLFGHSVLAEEEIDSALYSLLPLIPIYKVRDNLQQIFELLPKMNGQNGERIFKLYDHYSTGARGRPLLSSKGLQELCQALLLLLFKETNVAIDYSREIAAATQHLGLAMPPPLIVADTNWTKDYFGFVVNPGTGKLELWRVNHSGTQGIPIITWKQWLNGSRQDRTWGVYTRPHEYRR